MVAMVVVVIMVLVLIMSSYRYCASLTYLRIISAASHHPGAALRPLRQSKLFVQVQAQVRTD
jgi:hypothetical protein